jgi:Domain of unknown function (DUF4336)
MPLRELVPGQIWYAQQPLRFGPLSLTTRMTVVMLSDGSLWVHSPISPTPELVQSLASIGSVRFVVAPNTSHHLFFLPFVEAHNSCSGFVAPGLHAKSADLRRFPELTAEQPWHADLHSYFIEGLPIINETVWFHPRSGTLVVTDLLFCFGAENRGLTGLFAAILGVKGRLAMSRTMKMFTRDRLALAKSIEPLLSLPVQRIVLAHDQVIDAQASAKLREAFAWLQ